MVMAEDLIQRWAHMNLQCIYVELAGTGTFTSRLSGLLTLDLMLWEGEVLNRQVLVCLAQKKEGKSTTALSSVPMDDRHNHTSLHPAMMQGLGYLHNIQEKQRK